MLNQIVKKLEEIMMAILTVMMLIVVVLSIVELGWLLVRDIISPPVFILGIDELLDVFGMFLLVLIGIELLETLKIYIHKREIRAEVILLVAIIALSRKIITLDIKTVSGMSMLGIAAITVSLTAGYYTIKKINN